MPAYSTPLPIIEAAREFNRFYTNFLGLLNRAYLESAYTLTEARVLFEIASHNGIAATTLTRDLHLDPAYLSRIVKRFQADGLIETRSDPSDLRSRIINVTDQGRAQFEDFAERARAQLASRFDLLRDEGPARVVEAMRTIRTILDEKSVASEPVRLRGHRPGDIGWIVQSQGRFYCAEFGWDVRFEGLVAEIAGRFVSNFNADREYCWIAEQGGLNVGSVLVADGGDEVAKLRLLYVDKAARGLGLGKILVEECVRFSKAKGYRQLSLWTNDILDVARKIYVKSGFRLVSEERHRMFGPELNGQTWILDLDP
jgi:DNA-binding MarR family transcriptional regulator/GNAT superfamily N-acetyltransferase